MQMIFFPEINAEKTKANAKRKLREYPRWRRVANDVDGQKITATYTFEPRQAHRNPSKPVERLAINKIDAETELEAIEYAVSNLFDPMHRKLLHDRYLMTHPKSHFEIREEIGYEKSQYYELSSSALLSFAELYRGSCLVVNLSE